VVLAIVFTFQATLIMSMIMMMMITLHYPSALYPGRQSHIAELAEVVISDAGKYYMCWEHWVV